MRNTFVMPDEKFSLKPFSKGLPDSKGGQPLAHEVSGLRTRPHKIIERTFQMSLILLNRYNPIPPNYKPILSEVERGYFMEQNAAKCMKAMIDAAKNDGIELHVFSAYRTYDYQQNLFDENIRKLMNNGMSYQDAYEETVFSIALPGRSEHNAGLAADINTAEWQDDINSDFDKTSEFNWLINNSYKFGYVMRFPKGKEDITFQIYEPWHYRFVGCPHAEIMTKDNITLEEYVQRIKT